MGVVGGSRHYQGGGLGTEAGWKCPSCGAENLGPIAQGCALCGAGKPGHRAEPPPTIRPLTPVDEEQLGVFDRWVRAHPQATLEEAFTAGYVEGVRASRAALPKGDTHPLTPEGKINRTLVAALAWFRDQVLASNPEEVLSGEWCSADEVNALIDQLTEGARV